MPNADATQLLRLLVNGLHARAGGGVTYLRNMVPRLAVAPGVELHLALSEDQRTAFSDLAASVSIHVIGDHAGLARRLMTEQVAIPRLARRLGAQVTYSPANYGPLRAPGAVILLHNALSVAEVDRRPTKRLYWTLLEVATRASLARCRRAIAVSEYARRTLTHGLSEDVAAQVAVIPHGVGPPFAPPHASSSAGAAREGFVLAVGDLYVQKNVHGLLRAFAPLAAARPGLELRIAGGGVDPGYGESVRRLAAELDIARRVTFLGRVDPDSLADLYRRCAVFVFPSTVESFGMPLLEAMACGAPVACADAAAMPEVAGDAALYFDPHDPAAMGETMARVLDDGDLADDLSARGIARAATFTWERTAAETLQVLRDAAADGSRG